MYKLIIADDESIECRALEHKIKYMMSDIEVLPSVYDGISLMKSVEKYKPHIIIVDINMPGLNGLEVIELLKMKNISAKIIVNTAYSDFAFVQKALKMGASDYLLKPDNNEELIAAVSKVFKELDLEYKNQNQWQKDKAAADTLYYVAGEKWILSLILDEPDDNCYRVLLDNIPEISRGGGFIVWQTEQNALSSYLEIKRISGKILEEMKKFCHCIGVEHKEKYYLFAITKNQEQYEGIVEEAVIHICDNFRKQGILLSAGVSRYKSEREQFSSGIREAKIALQSKDGMGVYYFNYCSESPAIASPMEGLEEESMRLLQKGHWEECISMIRDILEKREGDYTDKEVLKIHIVEYMICLEEQIQKISPMEDIECPIPWLSLNTAVDVRSISLCVEQWVKDCYFCHFQKKRVYNLYVEKALLYIRENYFQDISLERTAEFIGISPFYLSRLLKQEKNQTFVEILTEVRIRKAIQLMRERQMSMKEICQSTGYSNMTYFYKVFKKATGFTVGTVKKYLVY